jgi:hypothetical protein
MGQGVRLTASRLAIGLAAAFAVTPVIGSLRPGIKPADPITFAIVPTVLLAIALAASSLPARRASRVDPVTAVRLRVALCGDIGRRQPRSAAKRGACESGIILASSAALVACCTLKHTS